MKEKENSNNIKCPRAIEFFCFCIGIKKSISSVIKNVFSYITEHYSAVYNFSRAYNLNATYFYFLRFHILY